VLHYSFSSSVFLQRTHIYYVCAYLCVTTNELLSARLILTSLFIITGTALSLSLSLCVNYTLTFKDTLYASNGLYVSRPRLPRDDTCTCSRVSMIRERKRMLPQLVAINGRTESYTVKLSRALRSYAWKANRW